MHLPIPADLTERIQQELASLSLVAGSGKVMLNLTFNVNNSKIGSLKINRQTEEEVRL